MMVIAEQSVECELAGETEVLEKKNLSQCQFVHQKSHMTWPGPQSGQPHWEEATNRLSYGTSSRVN
jgi:hypothetical protein